VLPLDDGGVGEPGGRQGQAAIEVAGQVGGGRLLCHGFSPGVSASTDGAGSSAPAAGAGAGPPGARTGPDRRLSRAVATGAVRNEAWAVRRPAAAWLPTMPRPKAML